MLISTFYLGFEKLSNAELKPSTYKSLEQTFPSDWPHIEYLILDAYFGTGSGNPSGAAPSKQYAAASVGLVATFSRGNVSINSTDTGNNPIISPNWLSDPRDLDMAVAAFRRGRQLFGTKSMQTIVNGEEYPGLNHTSVSEIENVIRQSANSVYNAAGTNKMGRSSDAMAVVDSKAQVRGMDRLRVVDASVFPFLPPGQPSATVCESFVNFCEGREVAD